MYGLVLTSLFIILSSPVIADTIHDVWDCELMDYLGDPIPYSEVMRAIESDGEYQVEGISIAKDTIWVTDPDGISIFENTVLEHDYVFVGYGFTLHAQGISLDGNEHSIKFGTEYAGHGITVDGFCNCSIENIHVQKNSGPENYITGIRLDHALYTIVDNVFVETTGQADFCIAITYSSNTCVQNSVFHQSGTPGRGISLSSNQDSVEVFNNIVLTTGTTNSIAINLDSDSEHTLIYNNTITSSERGIYLSGSGSDPEYTCIQSNQINADGYELELDLHIDNMLLLDQSLDSYRIVNCKLQIESSCYGSINYTTRFNATGSCLDSVITIEDNCIGVDTLNAPDGLVTTPASLSFYNPTIEGYPPYYPMMNCEPCPDSIFSNFQQSGDTLFSFDVTNMALEFSIAGTPNTIEVTEPDSSTIEDTEGCYIPPVSPNPSNGSLSLRYYLPSIMNVSICIYDVSGRLVSQSNELEQISGLHQFEVEELPSGIYTFRVQAGSDMLSERFVVLR